MQVSKYKVVSFIYKIIDEQGELFEQYDIPLDYIHGAKNQMYHKVEEALEGKIIGDSVEVVLNPEEGFGYSNPEMVFVDKIENVPEQYRHVGARPIFQNDKGEMVQMEVSKIDGDLITVDGNPPLAGQTVTFEIKILSIRDATESELNQVIPMPPVSTVLQ